MPTKDAFQTTIKGIVATLKRLLNNNNSGLGCQSTQIVQRKTEKLIAQTLADLKKEPSESNTVDFQAATTLLNELSAIYTHPTSRCDGYNLKPYYTNVRR